MSRRWQPTPTLYATFAVHGAAAAGLLAAPQHWPGWLAALAANHAVLTTAGLLPRSTLLGPNLTRLPAGCTDAVALTIDDGPDPEVTPQVLDLLDAAGARATFFCIGRRARAHPALCREIVTRGHRVENHGDAHAKTLAFFGPARLRADIAAAQACLADINGQLPRFFRATAGLRNPFLEPVLAELDLHLAAWTRRPYDTRCGDANIVLARLSKNLAAGDILLMHDGNAARGSSGRAVILDTLPALLDLLHQQGLTTVTLHAACS